MSEEKKIENGNEEVKETKEKKTLFGTIKGFGDRHPKGKKAVKIGWKIISIGSVIFTSLCGVSVAVDRMSNDPTPSTTKLDDGTEVVTF